MALTHTSASQNAVDLLREAPFQHYEFKSGASLPTALFFRPDSDKYETVIGRAAIIALRDPDNLRNVMRSGYGNFRLQPKRDIVYDEEDPDWEFRLKKRFGEERIDCEVAAREFFRAFFNELGEGKLIQLFKDKAVYIGKPAFQTRSHEVRYTNRIKKIFESLGFEKVPTFVYEPYAITYFCQHIAGLQFSPTEKRRRRTRILVVDHGGGTLSSCIVELTSAGQVDISATPVRPISLDNAGGRRLDEAILLQIINKSKMPEPMKQKFIVKDKLLFSLVDNAMLAVEEAKIQCIEKNALGHDVSVPLAIDLGIPGIAAISHDLRLSDVHEAFLLLWNKVFSRGIASTLKGESEVPEIIDHVILAGGTCKTGFHQELLEKHFAEFLAPGSTRFIDISGTKLPVVEGIACQALLDYSKTDKSGAQLNRIAATQNLSDLVANDLSIKLLSDAGESRAAAPKVVGEATIVRAGTPKKTIWETPLSTAVVLREKLPMRFQMTISQDRDDGGEPDLANARAIVIKRAFFGQRQKTVKISLSVNDTGMCYPQIAVAPTNAPKYMEPDQRRFHIEVPDLTKSEAIPEDHHRILSLDFGSVMSCISSFDLSAGMQRIESGIPLDGLTHNYPTALFTSIEKLEAREEPLSYQDQKLVNALNRISRKIGNDVEEVIRAVSDPSIRLGDDQVTKLRRAIENLLLALAPNEELRKAKIKIEPGKSNYDRNQRVSWALRGRSCLLIKVDGRQALLTQAVVNVLYSTSSEVIHTLDAEKGRREVERMLLLFRLAANDLLSV